MPLILAAPYFKRIAIVGAIYAVFDRASKGPNVILSDDNLTITTENATSKGARSTVGVTTGRYYFEVKVLPGGNDANICIGVGVEGSHITFFTPKSVIYADRIYVGSTSYGNIVALKAGDIMGVALNRDTRDVQFFLNGVNRGSVILPTLEATDKIYAYVCDRNNATLSNAVANFGQKPFAYPAPSGFTLGFPVPIASKFAIFTPEFRKGSASLITELQISTGGNGQGSVRANAGKSSGKCYWEVTFDAAATPMIGLGVAEAALATNSYLAPNSIFFYYNNGNQGIFKEGQYTTFSGSSLSTGTVIGIALDADTMNVKIFVNGVWRYTGILTNAIGKKVYPILTDGGGGSGSKLTANFGETAFKYSVPQGYDGGLSVA